MIFAKSAFSNKAEKTSKTIKNIKFEAKMRGSFALKYAKMLDCLIVAMLYFTTDWNLR